MRKIPIIGRILETVGRKMSGRGGARATRSGVGSTTTTSSSGGGIGSILRRLFR